MMIILLFHIIILIAITIISLHHTQTGPTPSRGTPSPAGCSRGPGATDQWASKCVWKRIRAKWRMRKMLANAS